MERKVDGGKEDGGNEDSILILSVTSRSLLTQDMGGDGFPKGIANGKFVGDQRKGGTAQMGTQAVKLVNRNDHLPSP